MTFSKEVECVHMAKFGDSFGQRFCPVCQHHTYHELWLFNEVKCYACKTTNYTIPVQLIGDSPSSYSSTKSTTDNDTAKAVGTLLGAALFSGAAFLGSRCRHEGCWNKKCEGYDYCNQHKLT
jgi:hypothetical protein